MELLNSKQACKLLGVSYSTLWRLVRENAFPSYKPNTGKNSKVYFDKEGLLQYIKDSSKKEEWLKSEVVKMRFSIELHFVNKLCEMKTEVVGDLFKAILRYAAFGTKLETDNDLLNFVFDIFKQQLDKEHKKCKAIKSKRVEAGKAGAKQRWGK